MQSVFMSIAFIILMLEPVGHAQSPPFSIEVTSFRQIYQTTGIIRTDVSEDCKYVSGVNELGQVFTIELSTSKVSKLILPDMAIISVCFSADGLSLYLGEENGNLSIYSIASGKIIGTIKPLSGIRQILRLGSQSLLVYGGGKAAIMESTGVRQMKTSGVTFSAIEDIVAYGGNLNGVLCESGTKLSEKGSRLVIDKDLRVVVPRFRYKYDDKESLRCAGLCYDDAWKTVYCTDSHLYCETEDVMEIKKSPHRFKSPPQAIYRLGSYWLICDKQGATIFNDGLLPVAEKALPGKVTLDPGVKFSYAVTKDSAVLAVVNDWDIYVLTLKGSVRK